MLVVSQVIGQEAIRAPGSTCITVKFDFLGFLYCTLANYRVVHLVLVFVKIICYQTVQCILKLADRLGFSIW